MTPFALITLALKQAGVVGEGQTASAEAANDTLALLNTMLGQWSRKRWLVFQLVDTAVLATGSASYTVGVGQAVNVPRPDRIEAAYRRYLAGGQPFDTPLTVLDAREDYIGIPYKQQPGPPQIVFYDPAYPVGQLYVWPVPAAGQWEIHVLTKQVLSQIADLRTEISLPVEYQEALLYNLAVRVAPMFAKTPRADIMMLAKGSLATIRAANAAIPLLTMPRSLVGPGNYNIYSDGYR